MAGMAQQEMPARQEEHIPALGETVHAITWIEIDLYPCLADGGAGGGLPLQNCELALEGVRNFALLLHMQFHLLHSVLLLLRFLRQSHHILIYLS